MTFTLAVGDDGQHLAQHKPLRSNFEGIGRRTCAGHIIGQELVKSWGLEPKDLETDRRKIEREINMATLNSNASPEHILRQLLEQAKANWGEDRAKEIRDTLEQASRQLSEVLNHLPDKETEPGFYQ